MMKRRGFALAFLLAVLFPYIVMSGATTGLNQTAPPSPVGSGARAMGTGGAFIAIADRDGPPSLWFGPPFSPSEARGVRQMPAWPSKFSTGPLAVFW